MSLNDTISRRYCQALFESARDAKALEKVEASMEQLEAALQNSTIANLMLSTTKPSKLQMATLEAIHTQGKLHSLVYNMVALLISNKRTQSLPQIINRFRHLLYEYNGQELVEFTTAFELNEKQRKDIQKDLEKALGKKIVLECQVSDGIIGGARIKIGSRMIDHSIGTVLSNIKRKLYKASLEELYNN
jgi:F-type H+-transporting ATPase subunit delta